MIDKLLMRLNARDLLSAEEEAALRSIIVKEKQVPADKTIVRAGALVSESTLLCEGIMARYKELREGGRQILALHVPGDFLDLHSFTQKRLDHNIMTLTPSSVAIVSHRALDELMARYPRLAYLLWFTTNLDAAIHREWMLSLGQRSSLSRAAHLFCELYCRLKTVGLAEDHSYRLKITQNVLAECLGQTLVHINRVLRKLRERGLLTFKSGRVTIEDYDALAECAEFDPTYLSLERRPRPAAA